MEQPSPANVNGGVTDSDTSAASSPMPYEHVPLAYVPPSAGAAIPPSSQSASVERQNAFHRTLQLDQQKQQQYLQEQLQALWADKMAESEKETEFKLNAIPLTRIKKIMKADRDVKMVAGEAPVVFAKACEMFIQELTLRAWLKARWFKRMTLRRKDVVAAIIQNDMFDFLVDIIPPDELKEAGVAAMLPPTTAPAMGPSYVPEMTYENHEQQRSTSDGVGDELD